MSSSGTMINDLTGGSVARTLIKFAYPFALSNTLQVVYNLVDVIIIGRFVGSSGLAATAVGGEIMMLLTMCCVGMSNSGQVMISQYIGLGRRDQLRSVIGTMFTCILSVSLVLSVIGLLFTDTFIAWVRVPEAAVRQAVDYVIVCFCGTFFIYGYNTVSAILRGMGDSRRPFVFIAVAACVNLVLDLLFVVGLHMDTRGAALATVIGQGVSFIISIIYLYRRRDAFGFDFRPASFIPSMRHLRPMLRLGAPMALQNAAISISFLFINTLINGYGVIVAAVTGVGMKLMQVMSIISNAVGTAGSTMIGQNFGAGKTDRCRRIVHVALICCLCACVTLTLVYNLFPRAVFSLFSDDPEVLAFAPQYMMIIAFYFLSFAFMSPYTALINGIGFAGLSLVIALLDGVISRIGLSLLFGRALNMGYFGIWLGSSMAGFSTALVAMLYFYSGSWKKRNLLVK